MQRSDISCKVKGWIEGVERIRLLKKKMVTMNLGKENMIGKQWELSRGSGDPLDVGDRENTYSLGYLTVLYF